jgi:hypothetical protein
MLFRMATPRRSKSGSITVRKGIPKDVRSEYERLYGPGWEAKLTVPAGTRPQDARVRIGEWTAEVETRFATIRAPKRGEGQSLSQRQAFALAGEWYVWYVGRTRFRLVQNVSTKRSKVLFGSSVVSVTSLSADRLLSATPAGQMSTDRKKPGRWMPGF